ncbi:MAG: cysteine methyltransferase [Chlamydiae bacterium CG10_big_fil_rev_8_21_14_0_10_42_34]|nr:MAG: cysteine methyltransferase [Chlamydiae bacterium CG10_big_fil_rev_8_21_14_0_10_42_34]
MKFDNGPKIRVEIQMSNGAMLSSRLFLSDTFSCTGATPPLIEWLSQYSKGKSTPLPLFCGSSFQQDVMKALSQIPFGKTITYGKLAEACSHPKAARAVGTACKKNPFPLFIPCHRVIQHNGKIGGFAYGEEIKRRILDYEAERLSAPNK